MLGLGGLGNHLNLTSVFITSSNCGEGWGNGYGLKTKTDGSNKDTTQGTVVMGHETHLRKHCTKNLGIEETSYSVCSHSG